MTITEPVYANREQVKRAIDVFETARANDQIDRLLQSSSRSVEGCLHRVFYPRLQTIELSSGGTWLNDQEVISVTAITYEGTAITEDDYSLSPVTGPPYNRIVIEDSPELTYTLSGTVRITGLFAGAAINLQNVGGLTSEISSSVTSLGIPNGALVGIGDLLKIGDEYLLTTGRSWLDSTQNLQTAMTASAANTGVVVSDGTEFAIGEIILLDTEQMWILDIAGNTLIVRRAYDGSVLAAHDGSDIYVSRTLSVVRGMVGSTAAIHTEASVVNRWVPPSLVNQLAVAETMTALEQDKSAYARVVGSGETAREARGSGLVDLRSQALAMHGRKNRIRSV